MTQKLLTYLHFPYLYGWAGKHNIMFCVCVCVCVWFAFWLANINAHYLL